MKTIVSQLSFFLGEREARRNLRALVKYLVFVLGVISIYSVLFHVIMAAVEGQQHSWLTGFYWTLTVMSTLGFGDITFHSDIGRLFSIAVLLSGVVLLLIMLPFAFIRFFYAPWLEAQIRLRAPRQVPEGTRDHVIICRYDSIARGLIRKFEFNRIPYFVIEPDPVVAARRTADDVAVISGDIDNHLTYERLHVSDSRLVLANAEDAVNSNIALTVREVDATVPIVALAEEDDSIDILELSGASHVLPLKQRLGEHLAARISTGSGSAHVVGQFKDLQIVEFVVHGTEIADKTLAETGLREHTGVNVVGVWDRGRLRAVHADLRLSSLSVPVAIGTRAQIARLDQLLGPSAVPSRPVLVIGGGKVGRATAAALKQRGLVVHIVEKENRLRRDLAAVAERVVVGDAADREVLFQAGLEDAGSVVLTTNDDPINIYLTVYCRRLKPDLTIVSRMTHERNIQAIYRAGADFVLGYASLGREYVIALLRGREPVMIGEGADFFEVDIPESLAGRTLGESRLGFRTGLIAIAIEEGQQTRTNPPPSTVLPAGGRLMVLGTAEQRLAFSREFD